MRNWNLRRLPLGIALAAMLALLGLRLLSALADDDAQSVTIPCPGVQPAEPPAVMRAAADGDVQEFQLIPANAGVTITDQHWCFVDSAGGKHFVPDPHIDPAWGGFTLSKDQNTLGWDSPTTGGNYTVKVKAKRHCPGGCCGGGGAGDDGSFEIDWGVTVGAAQAPGVPGAPTYANTTSTATDVILPAMPANAFFLNLQQKVADADDSTYVDVLDGAGAGTDVLVSGLTPSASYSFRCTAVGAGGSATGPFSNVTMLSATQPPDAPGAPSFSNITDTSVVVTAPAVTANTVSLSLLQKLSTADDSTYVDIADGLNGGDSITAGGLSATTCYTFCYVAVNAAGSTTGTPGAMTTVATLPAPDAPGVPTFGTITASTIQVIAPALPANADSLRLQEKLSIDDDSLYMDVAAGLGAGAVSLVTGLTPSTDYTFRYFADNVDNSTPGASADATTIAPPPAPDAPDAPTFSNVMATSLVVTCPALPNNATSLSLQQKLATDDDSAYVDVADGLSAGSSVQIVGLTPAMGYVYSCIAVGDGGQTPGAAAGVTTIAMPPLPGAPDVPTFSNVTATSLQVTAPVLPDNAASMELEQKLITAPDYAYVIVDTGLIGGSVSSITGLTAQTGYVFEYIAVNEAGSTNGSPGTVTTAVLPSAPIAPTFSNLAATSLTVTVPPLPSNADSLSLQQKLSTATDDTYVDVEDGLAGLSSVDVSGLAANTAYTFRCIAVGAGGSTPGTPASVTTLVPPDAPGAPTVTVLSATAVQITAPALPNNATSLSVEVKLATDDDSTYADVADGLNGGDSTTLSGLLPLTTYCFRVVAVGPGANIPGAPATATTLSPAPAAPDVPTFSGIGQTSLTVTMPDLPDGADSMSLEERTIGDPAGYTDIADGLAGGASQAVSGLTADTAYSFYAVAVGEGGSTSGNAAQVTTNIAGLAADAPGAPIFSNIADTSVTVTAPALPSDAASLTLQQKLSGSDDSTYVEVASGLNGGDATTVTGLSAQTDYTFQFIAVASGGSTAGTPGDVQTLPPLVDSPDAPILGNITATSLTATAPDLPANATSLTLQQKLTSDADDSYSDIAVGLAGDSVYEVDGLLQATSYSFRYVAEGNNASASGVAAAATTLSQPGAPGAPSFSNITSTDVQVTAPALPANASSLTLQEKLSTDSVDNYADIATGLAAGDVSDAAGLVPETGYDFRFVAVGAGGSSNGVCGSITTLIAPPDSPGAPTFSAVGETSLTVQMPDLPNGAQSLTLEQKLTSDPDTSYVVVTSGMNGDDTENIAGLTPGTQYSFCAIAIGNGGQTPGAAGHVTTAVAGTQSDAPGAPTFANTTDTTVDVTAPVLPVTATSLTLQQKLATDDDTAYADVASDVQAGDTTYITGLTAQTTYTFRYLAEGNAGEVPGTPASITTASAPAVLGTPGAVTFSNVTASGVTVTAPGLPANATNMVLQQKLATDDDDAYGDAVPGLVGNDVMAITGLDPQTSYSFRCVAVADGSDPVVGPDANMTTLDVPAAPGAPSFTHTDASSVLVTAPALPFAASSMTLQQKLSTDDDTAYTDVSTLVAGGDATDVTGLTPNTSYTFRYVAIGTDGDADGIAASYTTPYVPGTPDVPTFTNLTATSVTVTAPALPQYADSLTLQQKLDADDDSAYADVASGLAGGAATDVNGLTATTAYDFRYVAEGDGDETNGTPAGVTTLSLPDAPDVPTFSNVWATCLQVTAPALPANATSMTLQQKLTADSDDTYVVVETGLAGGAAVNVAGLSPVTSYTFQLVAVGAGGSTAGSGAAVTTKPNPPQNLQGCTQGGSGGGESGHSMARTPARVVANVLISATPTPIAATMSVLLTWVAPDGVDSNTRYNVKRGLPATDGSYDPDDMTTIASSVNALTYTDTTATVGVTYYYAVSTIEMAMESENSEPFELNTSGVSGSLATDDGSTPTSPDYS